MSFDLIQVAFPFEVSSARVIRNYVFNPFSFFIIIIYYFFLQLNFQVWNYEMKLICARKLRENSCEGMNKGNDDCYCAGYVFKYTFINRISTYINFWKFKNILIVSNKYFSREQFIAIFYWKHNRYSCTCLRAFFKTGGHPSRPLGCPLVNFKCLDFSEVSEKMFD